MPLRKERPRKQKHRRGLRHLRRPKRKLPLVGMMNNALFNSRFYSLSPIDLFWILDFPGLGPKFLVMIMVMIPAVSAGIWHMAYHYIIYMP